MAQPLHRRVRTGLFYALRTAFRIAPMPEATRDKLRQRFLDRYSNLIPPGPKGQISEGTRVRRSYVRSDERAIGYVPYAKGELPDPLPATLVAFYLPQFHTIPENDEWWGKGFTEWRNVTRALPQFEGHYQPKLPGDLGFYDLRNPEVMREQSRLASEYGISAFCFYFYWFAGKTLLETPLRNWLADPTIDLKFCLCWANEKWTRTWDGRGDEILIDQKHSPEDDLAFIEHVAEYMRDPRYLRVDGKPVLLVYRPGLFPEMAATAARWRKWCSENGIGEIHLAYVQSFERPNPRTIGFDAAVEFPPNLSSPSAVTSQQKLINPDYRGQILDWRNMVHLFRSREQPNYILHSGVNCGWDNEARRPGEGRTYLHSSPRAYRDWIRQLLGKRAAQGTDKPLIFINAWNEWAEGAVLEPCARLGYAYLDANRQALCSQRSEQPHASRLAVVIHAWYVDIFEEILQRLQASNLNARVIITTSPDIAPDIGLCIASGGLNYELVIDENRGRDVLPFLRVADRLLNEGCTWVLKLHTKHSPHISAGSAWRNELLENLLNPSSMGKLLQTIESKPSLGLIIPTGHALAIDQHMGGNLENLNHLLRRLGTHERNIAASVFPAGSMYFVRLEALRSLLDAGILPSEFESECGQVDGTFAHAIERAIAIAVTQSGFDVMDVETLLGQSLGSSSSKPYRYVP